MPPKRSSDTAEFGGSKRVKATKPKKNATRKQQQAKHVDKPNLTTVSIKKQKKTLKLSSKTINYSLCIPTSIIENCSNLEQITHTVYQVAKSATIFNSGEIVILDLTDDALDGNKPDEAKGFTPKKKNEGQKKIKFDEVEERKAESVVNVGKKEKKKKLSSAMLIASLLQFFVTPPYLVKSVFKKEYLDYFKFATKLPRLTALPFMRYLTDDKGRYREGLAIRMNKPGENTNNNKKKPYNQTKYINIGKDQYMELKGQLVPVNVRVTVDTIEKKVVSPEEAYGDFVGAKASYGYHVRISKSFADIFTQCCFSQGYTQTIWVNSGDFYYNETTKKNVKINSKIPKLEKVVKPTLEELAEGQGVEQPANLLVVFGKWNHILDRFEQSKDQFEGCEGAFQFFDGQLELPGAAPHGYICIEDGCMIALTILSTM